MMVEAGGEEIPDALMLEAILFAHEEIKKSCSIYRRNNC